MFDQRLRALRRDRAARLGVELFLYERAFDDCLERIALLNQRFAQALLIGCPDPSWPSRLASLADHIEVRDPGPSFAARSGGEPIIEDAWEPQAGAHDLVVALGTLDTVDDLPLALRLIRHAMTPGGLLIGAVAGGDSLPQLRAAMRAADMVAGGAAAHVHPRIEPAALAPLLESAGWAKPVVDIDRVQLSYPSLDKLVTDLRAMGVTNILQSRPRPLSRVEGEAARHAFAQAGNDGRTVEIVEIIHFAAWSPSEQ